MFIALNMLCSEPLGHNRWAWDEHIHCWLLFIARNANVLCTYLNWNLLFINSHYVLYDDCQKDDRLYIIMSNSCLYFSMSPLKGNMLVLNIEYEWYLRNVNDEICGRIFQFLTMVETDMFLNSNGTGHFQRTKHFPKVQSWRRLKLP